MKPRGFCSLCILFSLCWEKLYLTKTSEPITFATKINVFKVAEVCEERFFEEFGNNNGSPERHQINRVFSK